jgi:hypothetical protein
MGSLSPRGSYATRFTVHSRAIAGPWKCGIDFILTPGTKFTTSKTVFLPHRARLGASGVFAEEPEFLIDGNYSSHLTPQVIDLVTVARV